MQKRLWSLAAGCALVMALGITAQAGVIVSVGYDDLTTLNPWINSPNVTFLGDSAQANSSDPDEAALLLQNTGNVAVNLGQGFFINYGTSLQLWDSLITNAGVTIKPGASVILSGTTSSNMDLSDVTFPQNPIVGLIINGASYNFTDTKQVLRGTGGADESIAWSQIGDAGPAVGPEPGTLSMLGLALIAVPLLRRRLARKA